MARLLGGSVREARLLRHRLPPIHAVGRRAGGLVVSTEHHVVRPCRSARSMAGAGRPAAFLPCPALATDPSQNVSGISGLGYLAAADVLESLRGAAIRVEARLAA